MSASQRTLRFALTVIFTALLAAWAGRTGWQKLHQLRHSFATMESDAFHFSDYLEDPVRNMNEALLDHASRPDQASRKRFLENAEELRLFLRVHQGGALALPQEEALLVQFQAALDVYLSNGLKLMEECDASTNVKGVWEAVEHSAAPLLDMCNQLAEIERKGLGDFMKKTHTSLRWLEGMLAASLVLLVGLMLVIGLTGYRELLAPLRSQLQQSRVIIERHEKLASLGTLAAGVAHEIRNPLTAINVRIHGLKRNLAPGSSEHEDAVVIASEIQRLEGIVQAFLQFARPSEPKFATLAADHLLARVRTLFAGNLEKASIELILESPPDLWVRVDPQQIEQVLINLVQNAAESIQRNGSIRLRAHADTAMLGGRSRHVVVLEVSDTGKGIPPEVQKRLFDPFFTTKEEGTGLGLCIAARIIEQQGGALRYETQVNRGTRFSILLPEPEHADEDSP